MNQGKLFGEIVEGSKALLTDQVAPYLVTGAGSSDQKSEGLQGGREEGRVAHFVKS